MVNDNGPNHGFLYVARIRESFTDAETGKFTPTAFYWEVSGDLENPPPIVATGQFAQAQCGNYNPVTNSTGFISVGNLDSNARGHEAGTVRSHWTLYKAAQDDPANNLGVVADRFVELADPNTFNTDLRRGLLNARTRIGIATDDESLLFTADYNQFGIFLGDVNFVPYASCAP